MTLGILWIFDVFLEKVIQLGWFGMLTKSFSFLFEKLRIKYIIDYDDSSMNIMSKSFCASKIVLVNKLFL